MSVSSHTFGVRCLWSFFYIQKYFVLQEGYFRGRWLFPHGSVEKNSTNFEALPTLLWAEMTICCNNTVGSPKIFTNFRLFTTSWLKRGIYDFFDYTGVATDGTFFLRKTRSQLGKTEIWPHNKWNYFSKKCKKIKFFKF